MSEIIDALKRGVTSAGTKLPAYLRGSEEGIQASDVEYRVMQAKQAAEKFGVDLSKAGYDQISILADAGVITPQQAMVMATQLADQAMQKQQAESELKQRAAQIESIQTSTQAVKNTLDLLGPKMQQEINTGSAQQKHIETQTGALPSPEEAQRGRKVADLLHESQIQRNEMEGAASVIDSNTRALKEQNEANEKTRTANNKVRAEYKDRIQAMAGWLTTKPDLYTKEGVDKATWLALDAGNIVLQVGLEFDRLFNKAIEAEDDPAPQAGRMLVEAFEIAAKKLVGKPLVTKDNPELARIMQALAFGSEAQAQQVIQAMESNAAQVPTGGTGESTYTIDKDGNPILSGGMSGFGQSVKEDIMKFLKPEGSSFYPSKTGSQ